MRKLFISLLILLVIFSIGIFVISLNNQNEKAVAGNYGKFPSLMIPNNFGVQLNMHIVNKKDLDMIKDIGFKYVRFDMFWDHCELTKGSYKFDTYDTVFSELKKRGLKAIAILAYGNKLYEPTVSIRTEKGRIAFANFAKAAAQRYKDYDVVWEIWNEPDSPAFWKPVPNFDEYLAMLKKATPAIKSVDPEAVAIGPAVTGQEAETWEYLFQKDLLDYVDGVSVHLYRDIMPESSIEFDILKMRQLIEEYKPDNPKLPIISSEWGYSIFPGYLNEDEQAAYAIRTFLTNIVSGIPISIWYEWRNPVQVSSDPEKNFGLVRYDYSYKPAYHSMKDLIDSLNGMCFVKRLPSDPSDVLLLFTNGTDYKVAAWTLDKVKGKEIPIISDVIYDEVSPMPKYIDVEKDDVLPILQNN